MEWPSDWRTSFCRFPDRGTQALSPQAATMDRDSEHGNHEVESQVSASILWSK